MYLDWMDWSDDLIMDGTSSLAPLILTLLVPRLCCVIVTQR